MNKKESKIRGALYGFCIGDAMGATTEFSTKSSVKKQYGVVKNILGGGYFKLPVGAGTDDTAMTFCVCDAIEKANINGNVDKSKFLQTCCENFAHWLKYDGLGCGGCCYKAITSNKNLPYEVWIENNFESDLVPQDKKALGNGSLMRALPAALAGLSYELNVKQGWLTHNNSECSGAIKAYHDVIESILNGTTEYLHILDSFLSDKAEPSGYIANTFNNVVYYASMTNTFEDSIIGPVNDGGDSDTIAAITGGITGAMYGFESIPRKWVDSLLPRTKDKIEYYTKLFVGLNK